MQLLVRESQLHICYYSFYGLQVLVASHTLTSCCMLYSPKSGLTNDIILSLLWRVPLCCCLISVAVCSGQAICLGTSTYSSQWDRDCHDRMKVSNIPVPPAPESIWVSFKVPTAEHEKLTEEVAK